MEKKSNGVTQRPKRRAHLQLKVSRGDFQQELEKQNLGFKEGPTHKVKEIYQPPSFSIPDFGFA